MSRSNVTVEGLNELMQRLRTLRSDSDRIIERGLLRAAHRVRSKAVLLCPVNTGELRNSIAVTKTAPLTVVVGTNKEYAAYVEYGTGTLGDPSVAHTTKTSWRWQDEQGNWHTSHGQAAQPFLRPALDPQAVRNDIATELSGGI